MENNWLYRILVPRTLFFRISNISWLLLIVVGIGQYFLMTFYWRQAVDTLLQRLNYGLADTLVQELVASLDSTQLLLDDVIERELGRLESLNPGIDIYILDAEGRVQWPEAISFYELPANRATVERHVLEQFFSSGELSTLPVYGPSPLFNTMTVFSAASFVLNGEPKTLYVNLYGRRFQVLIDAIEAVYFSIGGAIALAVLILCTIGMGLVAFFLVTRPFRNTVAAVHQFAMGDLSARVPVKGTDELATLGSEINAMAQTAVDSLEQVRQLDAARRKMVAMISHDLGAPLRTAQGELQRAMTRLLEGRQDELKGSLDAANKSINNLVAHVEELFELSKLETNEMQPEFEQFSLLDVVTEEIIPRFALIAEESNVAIEVDCNSNSLFLVYADISMIERVLSNLLHNAIRYNRPGGKVTISLRSLEAVVEIAIHDTGRGIPEQDLHTIFEPFKRSSSVPRVAGSSGLGLAIVKQIMEIHKQDIAVESRLGEGTTFRFTLPASPA